MKLPSRSGRRRVRHTSSSRKFVGDEAVVLIGMVPSHPMRVCFRRGPDGKRAAESEQAHNGTSGMVSTGQLLAELEASDLRAGRKVPHLLVDLSGDVNGDHEVHDADIARLEGSAQPRMHGE